MTLNSGRNYSARGFSAPKSYKEKIKVKGLQPKDKREAFTRLAADRLGAVLHHMEALSRLSNRRNYDFVDKDVEKIREALTNATKQLLDKFDRGSGNPVIHFDD